MFLFILLLWTVSFCKMTVYAAEPVCRDITINGSSISYYAYRKKIFFNQAKGKAYEHTDSLSIFNFNDNQNEPISAFINNTNLEKESKDCINAMLNATEDFEKLLNGSNQGTLKYCNLVLLSNFITSICDPQRQTEDNLVRHSLHVLLYNIKKLRDVTYSKPYYSLSIHIITRTWLFKQFILLLIINLFLPSMYFTIARKYIPVCTLVYGMYVLYRLKVSWLPLYLAHKKYTAEYDKLTLACLPLSAEILKSEDEKNTAFHKVLTSVD